MFRALVVNDVDGAVGVEIRDVDEAELPDGDVVVDVEFSTLNYKDGLAVTNGKPVVRSFPMVPGIDFAGTVASSDSAAWSPGDRVLLNGYGVGESHWGGFGQKARVDAAWLLGVPDAFSTEQAMAIGTAGYTAMLCVQALEDAHVTPADGDVVVTGAAGGVGSVAIALLANRGFRVVASTGRPNEADYLRELGAAELIDRAELGEPGRALGKERWAAGIDAVGSHTLANVLASTSYGGTVAACGLAQGADLPSTVMPFIIRGVTLVGVDSVMAPMPRRVRAWEGLASELDPATLASMTETIGLDEVPAAAARILAGGVRGRTVVDLSKG